MSSQKRGGGGARGGKVRGGGNSAASQRSASGGQQNSPPTGQMGTMSLGKESQHGGNEAVCNIYAIDVLPGAKAFQYDVNVIKVESNGREKSLAKGADDGQRNLNKRLCSAVMRYLCENTPHCGLPAGAAVVYDGKAMLYASKKLAIKEPRIYVPVEEVDDALIRHYVKAPDHKEFIVEVKPTEMREGGLNQHEVPYGDFKQYKDSGKREQSRLVRTLLEMVTSQPAINRGHYTSVSPGKLFRCEAEPFNSPHDAIGLGMEFRCGVDKGVKVIDNGGKPKAAVVLDAKLSLFYKAQPLAATLREIFAKLSDNEDKWQLALDLLEGVRVELTYKPHRSVIIGTWSRTNGRWKPAEECEVRKDDDGEIINVPKYFRDRYECVVELAHWPCVISKGSNAPGNKVEAFPIDFCRVLPDQRVSQDRKEALMAGGGFLTQRQKDTYRMASIMPPEKRLEKIGWHAKQLGLFDGEKNAIFKAFGISIADVRQRAIVRRRALPGIKFNADRPSTGSTVRPDTEKANWVMGREHRYAKAATIDKWALVYQSADSRLVGVFVEQLRKECAAKGMRVAEPKTFPLVPGKQLADAFAECERKAQLLMFIDRKENVGGVKTHGMLKLLEARHKVLTQQLALEKVRDVVEKYQRQTLANMIHKMNCKVGGLNYWPVVESVGLPYDLAKGETLVLGLDVSHPSTGTISPRDLWFLKVKKGVDTTKMHGMVSFHPSVVGVCGNFATDPFIFAGDYFYQEARREAIDTEVLKEYVKWMLAKWVQSRAKDGKAKSLPKNIVVLRDGLSEGQFEMAEKKELPAIRAAALEVYTRYGIATKPKLMFVIGTKRHAKRFFNIVNGRVENLKPGSVISSQVTRPDCDERYIQASRALQGTAKTVQYAKLCNEVGMSDDQYEAFLLALCFNHQISNCATSLPEPIYQADELAKRGKDNFDTMRTTHYNAQIPRDEVTGKVLAETLTEMLGYKGSSLECLRVTA